MPRATHRTSDPQAWKPRVSLKNAPPHISGPHTYVDIDIDTDADSMKIAETLETLDSTMDAD